MRNFTRVRWLAAFVSLLLFGSLAAADTKLLRFPHLHGDRVVFVYGGDLWSARVDGGEAVRLTSHPGLELFPRFSPDGEWIAFTGQYDGDEQVYVIPSRGGEPRQLTWYPARGPLPPRWGYDHQVMGWTPDGESVLFRSHRDGWDSSDSRLYTVPRAGGLPQVLPMPVSGAGVFAGSDRRVFYSPLFRDFRTWKRYQGGWAQDLWLFDMDAESARKVAASARTERDPMWIGDHGYFVSDRTGTLNLFRFDPATDETEQLTFHEDWDVRWASADNDGRIIYELNGALRIFDTRNRDERALSIQVPADRVSRRARHVAAADYIHGWSLSPSGNRVVFWARGDLFNVPVGSDGLTRNLTARSHAHDREADWSHDGGNIVFVSDESGEEGLYTVPADGSEPPREIMPGRPGRLYNPLWSPDGDHVAVSDHEGRILVVRADGRAAVSEAGRDPTWRMRDYRWSPDSRYLAFSISEPSGMRAIHIYSVADARSRRVTDGLFSEYQPDWSPDGKYLYFLADREFAPQISQREWNYATNRSAGIYGLALTPDHDNPMAPRNPVDEGVASGSNGNDGNNGRGNRGGNDPVRVNIDWDRLADRLFRVPVDAGNYSGLVVLHDGLLYSEYDAWYYGRGPERRPRLKRFSLEERESTDFAADIGGYSVSADRRKVLIVDGDNYRVFELARNGGDPERVTTRGMRMEVDPAQEWRNVFHEVWRRFRDHFYVENMHGYDWEAIRDAYEPWLEHVAHRADLNYLLGEMIAELNVSHAYVDGGDLGLPERQPVALLGARFELDTRSNRYRIASIFPGQNDEPRYRSPLTELGVNVAEGDYLLAVNGRPLTGDDNPYRLLRLPRGQAVELTVNSSPDVRGARRVLVNPIDEERPLQYLQWVTDNHRRVTEASDGRLGYLHIPDMGPDGIREFVKWFYGQLRTEGLVVDVRGNGGGNVSQMIIERLARRTLALGYARTHVEASTYPYQAYNGHMVALLSETSASDGDIFPYQFRNAGLGPLIGKRSWGGVVGITGHGPLIDGGGTNVPEFGFSNTAGEYVVEGEGVAPDIEVENDPMSVIAGHDRQLERGIAELLRKLESDPRSLPDLPEAPVKLN